MFRVLAFYKYVTITEPEVLTVKHLKFCKKTGIKGRVIIAGEGINGTVSGTVKACDEYIQHIHKLSGMEDVEFKMHLCDQIAFDKIFVRYKDEIVNSGLKNRKDINPADFTAPYINATVFKKLKDNPDTVILDVRSNYEHQLGKFKNAVTLDIENFRYFPDKINELEKFKNKKIITYCTGGIKCEKASAFLLKNGFMEVYQLEGGILKYAEEGDGEDFQGNCYVFDKRISIPVNKVNPEVISYCIHCKKAEIRMVNCSDPLCNDQVVMCQSCGWEWEGACSLSCKNSHDKRIYDGSGYYGIDTSLKNRSFDE